MERRVKENPPYASDRPSCGYENDSIVFPPRLALLALFLGPYDPSNAALLT
jgi:hypothetical protein